MRTCGEGEFKWRERGSRLQAEVADQFRREANLRPNAPWGWKRGSHMVLRAGFLTFKFSLLSLTSIGQVSFLEIFIQSDIQCTFFSFFVMRQLVICIDLGLAILYI